MMSAALTLQPTSMRYSATSKCPCCVAVAKNQHNRRDDTRMRARVRGSGRHGTAPQRHSQTQQTPLTHRTHVHTPTHTLWKSVIVRTSYTSQAPTNTHTHTLQPTRQLRITPPQRILRLNRPQLSAVYNFTSCSTGGGEAPGRKRGKQRAKLPVKDGTVLRRVRKRVALREPVHVSMRGNRQNFAANQVQQLQRQFYGELRREETAKPA